MSYKWGKRSLRNLQGIHPDLRAVCDRAIRISEQDMTVIEGLRTVERQRELLRKGFSKTMRSRHLTGHAVDIVPYPIAHRLSYPQHIWDMLAEAMFRSSDELNVPVEWGYKKWGWDHPHWQLPWRQYPK